MAERMRGGGRWGSLLLVKGLRHFRVFWVWGYDFEGLGCLGFGVYRV